MVGAAKEAEVKLSKSGIALVVIGIILVIMAPIWKWVIGPQFVKIPDNLNETAVYDGTLTLYANPVTLTLIPAGLKIPITVTRRDISRPASSTSSVAVIEEKVLVTTTVADSATKTLVAGLGYDKFFALNRKSSKNVSGYDKIKSREGYSILFPMGTQEKTYPVWDDDTGKTGDVVFVKESTLDGVTHKGVKVFRFTGKGTIEKMVAPPAGFPAQLPGSVIKQILGNPNLVIPDTALISIDYFKKTDATIVVEPRTGAIVDIPAYRDQFYVNRALSGPADYLQLASVAYSQTKASTATGVDNSAKYFGLLDLVQIWLPLIFLVVGLIILIVGVFLGRKPSGAKA
jgi:hypothetical protein